MPWRGVNWSSSGRCWTRSAPKSGDLDRESDGRNRLAMLAAARGDVAVLGLLLDRGAAHKVEWSDRHTLLAEAARRGHLEAARLLIDRGASLHDVGRDG